MKKLIALLMTIAMLFSVTATIAGCKKPTSFGDGDDVVIQFQLDNLGFGTHWLQESCDRFMEQQKDVEYPGGKTGVYCHIVRGNTPSANNIQQSGSHVVFRGGRGDTLAETGNVWNMNEVVTNMEIPGEPGVYIEDKLYPESKAYFRAGDTYTEQGELIPGDYYTLPAHEIYAGISYDKKLFDSYGFYFARTTYGDQVTSGNPLFDVDEYDSEYGTVTFASTLTNQFYFFLSEKPLREDFTNDADYAEAVAGWEEGKSCGPNGIYGDYDDGLASSLYELIALWEYMKSTNRVNPFLVSGFQNSLANALLDALPTALMGYTKARGQYDLGEGNVVGNGEVDAVVNFSYSGMESTGGLKEIEAPIIQKLNVTEESGYYTTWAVERYFTLATMEILLTQGFLDPGSTPGGTQEVNHLGAQKKFLDSGHTILGGQGQEIGMLLEYSYWWNESSIRGNVDAFQALNPSVVDREIRWMPLPVNIKTSVTGIDQEVSYRFAEQQGISFGHNGTEYTENTKGETNLLVQTGWSGFIIGKKAVEMDPAVQAAIEDWLLFFHSDAELSAVTVSQGFRKGLIYPVEEADRSKWASFYSDLYDLSEKSIIIRPASETRTFMTGVSSFMSRGEGNKAWNCKHGQYFACWTKAPSKTEDRSSRRCFIQTMIRRDQWSTYYRGGEDVENITALYYPGTQNEIIFVDGDDSKPT